MNQDQGNNGSSPELVVVMPMFNEELSVRKVVVDWFGEIGGRVANFEFLLLDDGSTDGTPAMVEALREELGARLIILSHPNRGHGQTCMEGYRWALARGARHVLQLDSDGQCDPQYFGLLWEKREDFDVVYGDRVSRQDGFKRVLASALVKLTLLVFAGTYCVDANSPYRLMKAGALAKVVDLVPRDFVLANIAVAVLLRRNTRATEGRVPIRFRARYGGEPSLPFSRFAARAVELVRQVRRLP